MKISINKQITLILFIAFISLYTLNFGTAEVDLYPFPSIDDVKPKAIPKKPSYPFAIALSKKFNIPEKVLNKAINKGLGRTEIIRLILISKKSDNNLDDLINKRKDGMRLSKIAESANLDNGEIRKEARNHLDEIIKELKSPKKTETPAKTMIAGTKDALSTKSTHYIISDSSGPKTKK